MLYDNVLNGKKGHRPTENPIKVVITKSPKNFSTITIRHLKWCSWRFTQKTSIIILQYKLLFG